MEVNIALPGNFWPSTIVNCLERALAASYGYGYVGFGNASGTTRWRWEEIHDPQCEHRPGLLSSAGVTFYAWEEAKVSLLWGLIRFWWKTGSSIALGRMLKDMKEHSVNLEIAISNTAGGLYEREVPKIRRRLCFELELSGEAA